MNIKEKFSRLSPTAKLFAFGAVLALGILLLVLGGGETAKSNTEFDGRDIEKYRRELENSIKELCESVSGVSDVTVAVSLSGGFEFVYATDSGGKIVTVGSGSSATGVILRQKVPEIAGVGIVCSGGGDAGIKNCLISLISAAYGIGTNRIFVTEAKK